MKEITITSSDQGKTVLSYLKKKFPIALVHKIFRKNGLRVNGLRAKEEMILKKGDVLKFFLDITEKKPAVSKTSSRGYDIIFEGDDFMILNKHPGVPVHEGDTISFQMSLIGQLRSICKPKGFTPLLVHRLDTNTSGCLIVAKNEAAKISFEEMFKTGKIEKEYSVLVNGVMREKQGQIDYDLPGRQGSPVNALTFFQTEKVFPRLGLTLVKAKIKTGRKHQIRLHFARINHHVIMDTLHGNFELNKSIKKRYGLKRQFLHAQSLAFEWKGKRLHFTAPLSEDLEKFLKVVE